jgi:hypothetical protein
MCQVDDNLMLLYHQLSSNNGPERINSGSQLIYDLFSSSSGSMPQQAGIDFVVEDKSRILKKNYSDKLVYNVIGEDYPELVKSLLKANPQVLAHLFKGDVTVPVSIFSVITGYFNAVLENIYDIAVKINAKSDEFFEGQESWSAYLSGKGGFKDWEASGRLQGDFSANLKKLFEKIDELYTDISGKSLQEKTGFSDMINSINTAGAMASSAQAVPVPDSAERGDEALSAPSVISTGLQKSIYQIFEFSMMEKEFQNRMLKLLNEFKTMKNPFNTESDGRKVRRFISQLYWDLYKQVFVRTKTESSVPKAVRLMLNFGFLDDEMLEPSQVIELNDLARMRERTGDVPVVTEYEFLSRIYSGDEEPSITEMGLSYEAFLREQDKYQKKDKKSDRHNRDNGDDNEENLNKTLHEIEQRLASTAAVCSGGTATAFPILTSEIMKGSLKTIFQTKSSLTEITKKIMDIDFSLFYRETVLKLGASREIIKEEILPYIIILPIYGTKTLLWQEMTGNNKRSRGRIMVPAFFMGDLEKSLMHTFACFRWEINRSIKGAMWADPIDGGITGEYFDYVNTYKKNTKLSQEAKEKIAVRFKSLRTNRDRFADDYVMWVGYEKEGIMKLNNVVREMFFKHIPFRAEIREQLESMPAFSKYANRYKNVNARDIAAYERKFKKYQDEAGNYPPEIDKYFEFMKK